MAAPAIAVPAVRHQEVELALDVAGERASGCACRGPWPAVPRCRLRPRHARVAPEATGARARKGESGGGRRWTRLRARVDAGSTAIGLHAFDLEVHTVRVNGEPAAFEVAPHPRAPDLIGSGGGDGAGGPGDPGASGEDAALDSAARELEAQYRDALECEERCELVIQVREGARAGP